jgi:UDP-glucose 4-epimerase
MTLKNKTILITGGAGYLGKALIKRLYNDNKIIVMSRDEAKHYYLSKEYPNVDFYVGDVADYENFARIGRENSIDIGIFCASLKQIEACDENHEYAMNTILKGAINSRKFAEEFLLSGVYISSDKATAPGTYYGMLKAAAESAFTYKSKRKNTGHDVKLSACRYGNIVFSTGSSYCLMHEAIKNNFPLKLFSDKMTRFYMDVNDAVELILTSLNHSNQIIVPRLKSYLIKDSFEIFAEKFGLKYSLGEPRPNEKLHELMISQEEMARVERHVSEKGTEYFSIGSNANGNNLLFPNNEFSSKDCLISKNELREFLEQRNFFY